MQIVIVIGALDLAAICVHVRTYTHVCMYTLVFHPLHFGLSCKTCMWERVGGGTCMHVYVRVCVLQYATYAYVCGLNETCDVVCCIVVVEVVGTVLSPSVVYSASLHFSLSCLGHVGEE